MSGQIIQNQKGVLVGKVENAGMDLQYEGLTLEFMLDPIHERTNENAPNWDIYTQHPTLRKLFKVGSAWEKHTKEGEPFIQLTFEDNSLPKKIYVNAYSDPDTNGFKISNNRLRQAA